MSDSSLDVLVEPDGLSGRRLVGVDHDQHLVDAAWGVEPSIDCASPS